MTTNTELICNARALNFLAGSEERDEMVRKIKRLTGSLEANVQEALSLRSCGLDYETTDSESLSFGPSYDVSEMVVTLSVYRGKDDKWSASYMLHKAHDSCAYKRIELSKMSLRHLRTVYGHLDRLLDLAEKMCDKYNRLHELQALKEMVED
ncbi:MAG: hypothetical protein WAW92_01375 [Minisyncoccia bacterium]